MFGVCTKTFLGPKTARNYSINFNTLNILTCIHVCMPRWGRWVVISPISCQPNAELSSCLYHLKEERILMKVYIYIVLIFLFFILAKNIPKQYDAVHNVVKYFNFYPQLGGCSFHQYLGN